MTWLSLAIWLGCTGADDRGDRVPFDSGDTLGTATGLGTPGQSPNRTTDLFGDARLPGLRVVLHHREGTAPRQGAIDLLQAELDALLAAGHIVKPAGVRVELGKEIPAGDGGPYTFEELDAELEATRGAFTVGPSALVHGLYTDGSYDNGGEGTVLGFAYGGARMVLMREAIDDACDDPVLSLLPGAGATCDRLEATVLLHELGHLFGLVNNGVPMQVDHQDVDNGAHDDNDACLMYWAVETPAVAERLADLGGSEQRVIPFDAACLADLDAARAAAR